MTPVYIIPVSQTLPQGTVQWRIQMSTTIQEIITQLCRVDFSGLQESHYVGAQPIFFFFNNDNSNIQIDIY